MLLCALVRHPIPDDVAENVAAVACELGVEEDMVTWRGSSPHGSLGLAAQDFIRSGYEGSWNEEAARAAVHSSRDVGGRVGVLGQRPRAGSALGRPRAAAARRHRPAGLGDVPVARLHVSRDAGVGPAAAGPARLGPRARRLRHDGRVRGRGVRAHRAGQRRHARVLVAGDGDLAVRDRLPGDGGGLVPVVARALLEQPGHGGPAGRRHARAARCATTTSRAPTASTS